MCLTSLTATAGSLSDMPPGEPLGADIQDFITFAPSSFNHFFKDLNVLRPVLEYSVILYGDRAVRSGPIHLNKSPLINERNQTEYSFVMLMTKNIGGTQISFFRKFLIEIKNDSHRKLDGIYVQEDVPLWQTHFKVTVGLIPRVVSLTEPEHDLHLLYPIGIGSLDPNIMGDGHRILTPLYWDATLRRENVIAQRTDPDYYRGLPFMPITNSHGNVSPIAFHITILPDDIWKNGEGKNFLVRGFDSHGCMRLRYQDLIEFFTIVMDGGSDSLPLSVNYFLTGAPSDSYPPGWTFLNVAEPYPLRLDGYKRVKNFSPPGQPPSYQRDENEHLVILEDAPGLPDLNRLNGFSELDKTYLKLFNLRIGAP